MSCVIISILYLVMGFVVIGLFLGECETIDSAGELFITLLFAAFWPFVVMFAIVFYGIPKVVKFLINIGWKLRKLILKEG